MSFVRVAMEPVRPAPALRRGRGLRRAVTGVANILASLVVMAVALAAVPRFLSWAVTHGIWRGDGAACRAGAGACWSFLAAKMPFILFGIYPEGERWRPAAACALLIALILWSMPRHHWTRTTLALWGAGILAALGLMAGGMAGLSAVPTSAWGGLPITLLLTILSLTLGFPLALALALARQSPLPAFRWLATAFIEVMRGLPLLTILLVASLMTPLLLPSGMTTDTLLRALIAFTLSAAAYLAEILRAGLRGVLPGQAEAAQSLGLGRAAMLRAVILPQAVRSVLPPLTNTVIVIIKNTSLVLVVGLFDLLSAGRVVLSDPAWPSPYAETYLFIGLLYFIICYGFSRYALHLERGSPA